MASTVNQQQSFPAVPPSFSAGDHEMRDYHAPQDAPLPQMNQTPYLTPYLGLRARLSQIWINRWTILLLLVLVRLLFAIANVNNSLASARTEALSACTQVENIGSSLASMPYYMAQGVNELTATGVEKAVSGLMSMLSLSVTGVEEIVLFVINMMTGTYLCLITLAVTGSLHAAVELGEEVVANLNKTIDSVTGDMGSAVSSVNSEISSLISKIQSLPFVPGFSTPTIDLNSSITALKGLESDTPTLTSDLQKLNDSIPTFDQVKNFTNNAISLPFEEVQKLIQGMNNFTFDRSLLPVPDKETLSFCSDGNSINDFFDELVKLELTAKKIALIVLIIFAILVCVPMAWSETRRHRRIENRVSLLALGHDGMDVVYLTSRPLSSTFGLWLGNRFGSTRRQNIVRWAWAYATSLPMLFLLSLAIAGLFSCFCQYLLLRGIQKEVPELTTEVAGFAEKVVNSLNNASESWATGVNGAMGKLDADINNDILGWVNTTTGAINNTLNTFINETSEVLNSTFGGTILYDPIKDVLNCLIGLKVASFQAGLTWVSDHAHVSFPSLSNDTFSLGTLARLSNSSTAADLLSDPDGTTKDDITEAIDKVVNYILSGIRTEAEISLTLLLVWLFIATGGFLYACTLYPRQYQAPGESTAYNIDPAIDGEPKVEAYPDTAAPPYEYPVNKAAPYTLPHRQFPTFGPNDNVNTESESEKVGQVGAYPVAESSRPGHLRASSHGHLAQPSPIDDKQNPFLSDDEKRNPFK